MIGERVMSYENANSEDGQNFLFRIVTLGSDVTGGQDAVKGGGIAGDPYVLDRSGVQGIQIQIGDSVTKHSFEFKVIKTVGFDAVTGDLPYFPSNEAITFRRLMFQYEDSKHNETAACIFAFYAGSTDFV